MLLLRHRTSCLLRYRALNRHQPRCMASSAGVQPLVTPQWLSDRCSPCQLGSGNPAWLVRATQSYLLQVPAVLAGWTAWS